MSASAPASIALQVRQERLRLGWRQADIASRAGVSCSAYAPFETHGRIALERLVRIAVTLGLSIDLRPADGAIVAPNRVLVRQRGVRGQPTKPRPEKPEFDSSEQTSAAIPPLKLPWLAAGTRDRWRGGLIGAPAAFKAGRQERRRVWRAGTGPVIFADLH